MLDILLELKNELDSSSPIDNHQRQTTEALIDEINHKINAPEANMASEQYLIERLKSEIEVIQANHPQLTDLIGRLSDLLARIGI